MGAACDHTGSIPKVLVVDDEECIRTTVYELLTAAGIEVFTAGDTTECMAILRNGFRGVILMDVMMPGTNGWDIIRKLDDSGLLKGNIVSMLTAADAPDERMEGLQEIVIDYLVKPFKPRELIETVRRYFGYLENAPGREV